MSDYHINIFYSDEDNAYIADIPDLKYCSAHGETPEEALREVLIAKEGVLAVMREEGLPIPAPRYLHHRLMLDDAGERLAKRNQSLAIRQLRESGMTAEDVLALTTPMMPDFP